MAQYRLRLSDTLGTKEIPIPENAESLRIGTEPDCQVRLPREHYLCGFVLLLEKREQTWWMSCSGEIRMTGVGGGVSRRIRLEHGTDLSVQYAQRNAPLFMAEFREEPTGIRVSLISGSGQIYSLSLPIRPEGRCGFDIPPGDMLFRSVFMEVRRGKWCLSCGDGVHLRDSEGNRFGSYPVEDNTYLVVECGGGQGFCYAEEINHSSSVFHNYTLRESSAIRIGRDPDCDIVYSNRLVSGNHTLLLWKDGVCRVEDQDSFNGTFVNGTRVRSAVLRPGDVLSALWMQVIMGVGFVSINDGGRNIAVRSSALQRVGLPSETGCAARPAPGDAAGAFNRLPRRRCPFPSAEISIEGPPPSMNGAHMPLMLRMGSSMVMGGSAALAGNYTTLLSSMLFPLLTQKYSDKEKKEYETKRVQRYTEYLQEKDREIDRQAERERDALEQNYPPLDQVLHYTDDRTHLWERRNTDDDFLHLRIGNGQRPMAAEILYPRERFSLDDDALEQQMQELAQRKVMLDNVPIMADLLSNRVCGVLGSHQAAIDFVLSLIMRLCVLHSYDEVKTVFLLEPEDLNRMTFIRYLPHSWDNQRTTRFIAADSRESYPIGEYFKRELGLDDKRDKHDGTARKRPHYVVFAMSKRLFDCVEPLKDIIQSDEDLGVTVLTVFDDVPKECSLLFTLSDSGQHTMTYLREIDRPDAIFALDPYSPEDAGRCMRIVANTDLRIVSQAYSLPKTVTFLEMFGVGRVEDLNPMKRWRESNPMKSLSTPVGIGSGGELMQLDLHQKFQGPHGLVAGMTGSGKSEFLITYILSMAVNYHPDEVAFVLIDYKGGGLAGAFDDPDKGIHLPHLVGTITNLDGPTIQRALVSIQSELTRRQRIFNQVKHITDEGTMDIYAYQRLYRGGQVDEPMPHLFIISDEFAELKQQEPEFMERLISIARIGRSLGVHLILATQKPSGVVNDQILSNTKFRICLKVQDRSDSMDMLKRPEAAELKDTGRFYIQVGYNEFFSLGQSAWAGAPYEPRSQVVSRRDDSVQVIDNVGQPLIEVRPPREAQTAQGSELIAVLKELTAVAQAQGIPFRSLWKPMLPHPLDLEKSCWPGEENRLEFCAGYLDDPAAQRQFPLTLDWMKTRNLLICGDGGSGKTTLVQAMLFSLVMRYPARRIQFYVLDYSSRMLRLFKNLPHCGGVVGEGDDASLDALFNTLAQIAAQRKQLFRKWEADSFEAAASMTELPLILVVIDNISGLSATKKGENYSYQLQNYIKEGANYGIYYIVTANHLNEVPSRIRQEFANTIALHQKDKFAYADVLNCKVNYTPPEKAGRGMYNVDGAALEFQAAMFRPRLPYRERIEQLKQLLARRAESLPEDTPARRLPVVSETIEYRDFAARFRRGRIPLGFDMMKKASVALPLRQLSVLRVFFGNPAGVRPVTENLLYAARREKMELWLVKREGDSLFDREISLPEGTRLFQPQAADLQQLWQQLTAEMSARRALLEEFCREKDLPPERIDALEDTFAFLQEHTTPVLLFLESAADFCQAADTISRLVFDKVIRGASVRSVYIMACYEPREQPVQGNLLYSVLSAAGDALLLGGRLDRQDLVALPRGMQEPGKLLPYNRCVMQYQEALHPLLMPCGEIESIEPDEDTVSIFG